VIVAASVALIARRRRRRGPRHVHPVFDLRARDRVEGVIVDRTARGPGVVEAPPVVRGVDLGARRDGAGLEIGARFGFAADRPSSAAEATVEPAAGRRWAIRVEVVLAGENVGGGAGPGDRARILEYDEGA